MNSGFYTAVSGFLAQARAHQIRTNNLSNITTVGYKRDRAFFRLLVQAASFQPGSVERTVNSCVVVGGTKMDFSQGALRQTGNPLDLAIKGDGFFVVSLGNGQAYTRAGNFTLDSRGRLCDQNGLAVLGKGGEITLPCASQIVVDPEGKIYADGLEVGSLRLVRFANKSALRKVGRNLMVMTNPNEAPVDAAGAEVRQGYLESSNANVIEEMVSMIEGLRQYETHQRVIQLILNDSLGRAIQTLPNLR